MHRRDFLGSVSAVAIAATLPGSVFAKTPATYVHLDSGAPIAKFELIERALDAAGKLGFDFPGRRWLFGFEKCVASNTAELRDALCTYMIEYGSIDIWNRARFVIAIQERLADLPIENQHWHLDASRSDSDYTLREQMLGDQSSLHHVATQLGSRVTWDGFEQMRAFA